MESLAQLELLCERLYNSQDSTERTHAENTLKCFSTNIDYISQCQYILDNALTPYALMLASSSLLKQVTEHSLSLQLRLDIRNYLVNYLANRGPELQSFVIGSLVQLLCRLTKFGWFDDDRFRDVAKESINFLSQATSNHYAIGLKILNQLVCEMNQANPGLPSSHHRRVACSFRDQCLFKIFQISLTSLHQLKNDANNWLQELALSLSLKCLSFDFVGTSIDESSEEFGTVRFHTFVEYDSVEFAEKAVTELQDESNWRNGLKVRLLLNIPVKSTQARTKKAGHEGQPSGKKDEATVREMQALKENHLEESLQNCAAQSNELQLEDYTKGNGLKKGRNTGSCGGNGGGRGRGKGKGQGQGRGRHQHTANGGGGALGSTSLDVPVSNNSSKTSPVPRMPDGTKGFSMGRGKPLAI